MAAVLLRPRKTMKRTLAIALCAIMAFFVLPPSQANAQNLFVAKTTTGVPSQTDCGNCLSTGEISTAKATSIRIHIWDTVGSGTSQTVIKVRNAGDATTFYTVATITNPDTSGELWLGEGAD